MADDFRSALIASAGRLGLNPVDLATVISYETGGTFSPSIRGGAGNRHIGLIQFGPAEQKRYGASQGQSAAEQLPAVESYLTDRGFKPGMGILDLYSTINAGRPGRYNASDAGNGGAPGTVADKVNTQFGPHYKKAAAFLGGDAAMTMPGDTARSGRFGTSGVEASAATAPAMAIPEPVAETPSRSTDVLAMLAPLLQSGGALAQAAPAAAPPQQPMRAMMAAAETAPARFDADRFYALLRR